MTEFTFKHQHGDEQIDPEYNLLQDGVPTRISIQDSSSYGGGFSVYINNLDDANDPHVAHIREDMATLDQAKEVALAHARASLKP